MLRRTLVILGYLSLALLVGLITTLLVAYGQEYSFDVKKWKFVRTGLVVIQSTPGSLPVTIDGRRLKKKTTYREAHEAGSYTFELTRDGFYPWRKTLDVIVSEVTLVQYALLVPRKPTTAVLDRRVGVSLQTASEDRHRWAYLVSGPEAGVYTLDIGGRPVRAFAPAAATPTLPAETVTALAWSEDGSRLLVTTKLGEAVTYRVMSAGGGDVVNLTAKYKVALTGLQFSGNDWRTLYFLSPEGLRRVGINDEAVSDVLVAGLRQFKPVGGRVLYIMPTPVGTSLWSLDGSRRQELIPALADSDSYAMAYVSYRGHDQLAVVPARTAVGTLYTDIFSATPVAKTVARNVSEAAFSYDGHLLAFWGSGTVTTYDLERSLLRNRLVSYQVAGISGLTGLSWFDNFHLLLTQNNRLILAEFDGANQVDLGPVAAGLTGYGTADRKTVVAFVPDGAAVKLLQTIIK
jgi:hypothetical protein